METKRVRIVTDYAFDLPKAGIHLRPGERVELPAYLADELIAAGLAAEAGRRKFRHGSDEDRFIGAVLYVLGFSEAEIARVLGKDQATISRWVRKRLVVPKEWRDVGPKARQNERWAKAQWKDWLAFQKALGPMTPLTLAGLLPLKPFARALWEANRRAARRGYASICRRLQESVYSAVGAVVVEYFTKLPCPRCDKAFRPLDGAWVVMLHDACIRKTWPEVRAWPFRPCL
jgi:hypothetical protein